MALLSVCTYRIYHLHEINQDLRKRARALYFYAYVYICGFSTLMDTTLRDLYRYSYVYITWYMSMCFLILYGVIALAIFCRIYRENTWSIHHIRYIYRPDLFIFLIYFYIGAKCGENCIGIEFVFYICDN